jgi:hypothetical protein
MYHDILTEPLDKCMSKAAALTNTIIIIRAVNPKAIGYMIQGYPTKGLKVHAKSAAEENAPIGGMLAVDQRLCKNNLKGSEAIKATGEALSSIGQENRKGFDRIEAIHYHKDWYVYSKDGNNAEIIPKSQLRLRRLKIDETPPTAFTKKDFFMKDNAIFPLWLLGVNKLPLVADIDLFAIVFQRKHAWQKVEDSFKRVETSHARVGLLPNLGKQAPKVGMDYLGGIVEFEKQVIDTINDCFVRKNNPIVHHGAELSNAHYRQKETANLPVGIFSPNGFRFNCESKSQAKEAMSFLIGKEIDLWATFYKGAPYNSTIESKWFNEYGLPTLAAEEMGFHEKRHFEKQYLTDPTETPLFGDRGKKHFSQTKLPPIEKRRQIVPVESLPFSDRRASRVSTLPPINRRYY